MTRNLRSKRNQSIIELSDSDDEDCKTFSKTKDDDYVMEKSETKKKVADDKEPTKKRIKRNTQSKDATMKSVKRKRQEENLETLGNKKLKLEKPSSSDSKAGVSQQNQQDLTKFDTKQNVKIEEKLNPRLSQCTEWTVVDYISETNNVDKYIAENVTGLFKGDNTIPFIARYRRNMTGSMEADQLRLLKDSFEQANTIKHRAATIIKAIDKLGKWSPEVHSAITSTKCLADLEYIYSLYKPTSKRLLAERARELGLGGISDAVLQGQKIPSLRSLIDEQKEGLRSEEEVKNGILHVIADVINKDKEVFDKVISLQETSVINIQTARCKMTEELKKMDEKKYKNYFDFKVNVNVIKPHQILAINRAESQKILSVKIIIPNVFEYAFKNYCVSRYTRQQKLGGNATRLHFDLLDNSVDYAYKKFIKPLVMRRVRSRMKEKAETASIEVFATNVKQLLLTSPLRGKVVLGIDPGYSHGCKLAVVSEHGDVLETAIIHPHKHPSEFTRAASTLADLVCKHKCTVLALGNATACRETEMFLTKVLKSDALSSSNVMYTIVDESGASIYSCSPEAKSEFPDLDPNLISAASIARRLQDPLAELVKIEPKHLGVGMYQHDLPEKQLMNALDEVITEAVSFVGVDVNTASQCLLRRVAGLTNSRAASIIEWRVKHGAFRNREQLLNVKGIGKKTFEQCVGFVRILPETAMIREASTIKDENDDLNLLDQTWIHPESYAIANKFIKHCNCKLNDLGTPEFIKTINSYAKVGCAKLAAQFDTNEATMEIIVKALTMRKDEDIRLKSDDPLFRESVRCISDLTVGTILKGVVRNVTHFGAFVDIGLGKEGLMHITKMRKNVHIGQRVEVKVIDVEVMRGRIGLELIN